MVQAEYQTSTSNRRWRRLSAEWLKQYPFCTLCLAHGLINEGATEFAVTIQRNLIVDHITPHKGDVNLYWEQENWQTLCRFPCHDKDKKSCEKRGADWWELVRKVVREKGTLEFVRQQREWMPEHVMRHIEQPVRE